MRVKPLRGLTQQPQSESEIDGEQYLLNRKSFDDEIVFDENGK